jgi:ribosomal protein L16 Arg81 hydroxylase
MLDLDEILKPISVSTFISDYLGQQMLYVPGEAVKLRGVLTWSALSSIVTYHQFDGVRLRLMRDGQPIPRDSYVKWQGYSTFRMPFLRAPELARHLREGATLILDAIDWLHEPVSMIAQNLERRLNREVQVNAYAGWRESPGLALHWDRHDVLILQISGTKHWQIYGETRKYPLQCDVEPNPEPKIDPIWDAVLSAGDVLYIPRGWWHVAVPCDEPTLHLTVGLHGRTATDLLQWLGGQLKRHEIMRRDIPSCAEAAAQSEYLRDLQEVIGTACRDSDLLKKYLEDLSAHARLRTRLELPLAASERGLPDSDNYSVRLMIPRRLEVKRREDGLVEVVFDGRSCRFLSEAEPLLEYLNTASPLQMSQFYQQFENTFDHEDLSQFLSGMAQNGMIAFDGPRPLG